ncbi:MAG: DUF11 domain-containing protein, partial [Candidatus Latescibacterota bacterium]
MRAASTLLLVVLACHFAAAQPVIIDDFEADLDLIRSVSPDLDLPSTDPFTFLNPAVLGGETDVILNLVDAPDAASGVQVFGADGSFAIQSDPGTASRVFIVFDGMDGDAVRVLASGGLNGADLTRAGANDHFVLDIDNSGSALNISVDIYSSLETRSNLIVPIPAGWSGPLEIPFSDFAPVDSPADISSVNAMIMIVGAGGGGLGGAPGPIDLRINDFTAFGPPPVIPGGSGGGVIVDQLQTPVGDEWYITDFGGSNPFNALIQDDFVITATNGLTIQTVEFDGFYRPSPPSNPTADVIIRADNNGAPGDIVTTLPSLPVKAASDKTYSVDLGVNSPLLQTGTYWIGMQGNVPVGTEILTHSTSTPQGSPAHWENPGGAFGRSCPSATPLTSCGSSDESWRYKLISDFDPTAVDLNLDKDVEPDKVVLGDSITFTLVVTNFSEHTATGVHVADRLSGISNIMATSSQGSCSVSSEGALDCDVGSLESGASATITVTGQANSTTHTSNTAWASSAEHDSDPINNTFKTEWVVGRPISISKASTYDEYLPGNKIDFNMTITNTTSIPYSDLVLEDIYFNDQFKYVDATRDCINVQHTLTSTLSCAIPDIQPATTITYTTTMQALSPPAKSTNYAQVLDGAIVYGFGNRVVHVSDRWYLSDLNFVAVGGWDGGGAASSKSSQSGGAVDLYLGDTKVGEDLAFGQSTGWFTDTLGGDPKKLYIVPADSSDVTAAIDSLELLVDPGLPPGGGSSLVILVDDAAGDASTLVMDGVRREAADPGL